MVLPTELETKLAELSCQLPGMWLTQERTSLDQEIDESSCTGTSRSFRPPSHSATSS